MLLIVENSSHFHFEKHQPANIFVSTLVAPQRRKAKQRKILIFNENRDFLFSPKTQKSAVHDRLWWSKRWSKRVFQTPPP